MNLRHLWAVYLFERGKIMKKPKLSSISKGIRGTITKHSPEILTGIGIAGMITTTIMAVRATPKALEIINDERLERADNDEKFIYGSTPLPIKDVIRLTWKCYIPAAITGGLSIICLIGASSVNARRNAALATAYTLSESALKEYQEKVIETIGEKKEQAVMDAIAKDRIDKNPVSSREVIITEKGNTLCYDSISGRYFKSDIDKLKKTENELNRRMRDEMYISLNEFYYEIGLNPISIGDDIGWNIDHGYIELNFSSQLSDYGNPCLVIDYRVAPRYEYNR